jgi:hypothetical protein
MDDVLQKGTSKCPLGFAEFALVLRHAGLPHRLIGETSGIYSGVSADSQPSFTSSNNTFNGFPNTKNIAGQSTSTPTGSYSHYEMEKLGKSGGTPVNYMSALASDENKSFTTPKATRSTPSIILTRLPASFDYLHQNNGCIPNSDETDSAERGSSNVEQNPKKRGRPKKTDEKVKSSKTQSGQGIHWDAY